MSATEQDPEKAIQDELKARTDLLEKLLREGGVLEEFFPDEKCTISREGNTVRINAYGKTVRAEFEANTLDSVSLRWTGSTLSKREKIVTKKCSKIMNELEGNRLEKELEAFFADLEERKKSGDTKGQYYEI